MSSQDCTWFSSITRRLINSAESLMRVRQSWTNFCQISRRSKVSHLILLQSSSRISMWWKSLKLLSWLRGLTRELANTLTHSKMKLKMQGMNSSRDSSQQQDMDLTTQSFTMDLTEVTLWRSSRKFFKESRMMWKTIFIPSLTQRPMEELKTNSRKSLSSELRREALMKLLKKMQKTMRISQRQQSNIFLTQLMMMRRKKSPRSFSTL